jgi:hypothetical protein
MYDEQPRGSPGNPLFMNVHNTQLIQIKYPQNVLILYLLLALLQNAHAASLLLC